MGGFVCGSAPILAHPSHAFVPHREPQLRRLAPALCVRGRRRQPRRHGERKLDGCRIQTRFRFPIGGASTGAMEILFGARAPITRLEPRRDPRLRRPWARSSRVPELGLAQSSRAPRAQLGSLDILDSRSSGRPCAPHVITGSKTRPSQNARFCAVSLSNGTRLGLPRGVGPNRSPQ